MPAPGSGLTAASLHSPAGNSAQEGKLKGGGDRAKVWADAGPAWLLLVQPQLVIRPLKCGFPWDNGSSEDSQSQDYCRVLQQVPGKTFSAVWVISKFPVVSILPALLPSFLPSSPSLLFLPLPLCAGLFLSTL